MKYNFNQVKVFNLKNKGNEILTRKTELNTNITFT